MGRREWVLKATSTALAYHRALYRTAQAAREILGCDLIRDALRHEGEAVVTLRDTVALLAGMIEAMEMVQDRIMADFLDGPTPEKLEEMFRAEATVSRTMVLARECVEVASAIV